MKVDKLKDRYRVTIIQPSKSIQWVISRQDIQMNVINWCKEMVGSNKNSSYNDKLWYVPWTRAGIYVYFKHEEDALLFLLGWPKPKGM